MKTYTVKLTDSEIGQMMMALGGFVAHFATRKDDIAIAVVDTNLAIANKLVQAKDTPDITQG